MDQILTHMPFLTRDCEGRRILLYAMCNGADEHDWKLHYQIDDGQPQRLETGFEAGRIECSPAGWQDETGWHISFVAADEEGVYRLYRMDGNSLDHLCQPVSMRKARTGFVYHDRLAVGEIQDLVHVHDNHGDHKIEIPGAFIYRVSYRADSPHILLISGEWIGENEDVFTIEYNLADDTQQYIECDGSRGAYKCTIYGEEVVYAKRINDQFEGRKIQRANKTKRIPCRIAHRHQDGVSESLIQVTKRCGCRRNSRDEQELNPPRPSCIECVEKHVGAAEVLLSEIFNGYQYHFRFIGHLHEAEEESQEWPDLHELLRRTRIEYQKNGRSPDWPVLHQHIVEIRNACR